MMSSLESESDEVVKWALAHGCSWPERVDDFNFSTEMILLMYDNGWPGHPSVLDFATRDTNPRLLELLIAQENRRNLLSLQSTNNESEPSGG